MAKFRYLIERNNDMTYPFYLSCVDVYGESTGSLGEYVTVDDAKRQAEDCQKPDVIKWKDPPKEWQPDALLVSQYFEELYETNPPD